MKVSGIATTFMPTVEVIRKATEQGINLIMAHEPSYYNHRDNTVDFGPDDPVVKAKLDLLQETGITIYRFHDAPHMIADDMIKWGMIRKLGWENYHLGDMIFNSAHSTLGELAKELSTQFKTSTVRVVGDAKQAIYKIAFLPGAYGRHMQVQKFQSHDNIDVLLVGESSEWEMVEYVRDAIALGWNRSLVVMGHADSEEGGMEYVRDFLAKLFPEIKVVQIDAGNPLWSPR